MEPIDVEAKHRLKAKRRSAAKKRRRELAEIRERQYTCFWSWPWGHGWVYGVDIESFSYTHWRECVSCGKKIRD